MCWQLSYPWPQQFQKISENLRFQIPNPPAHSLIQLQHVHSDHPQSSLWPGPHTWYGPHPHPEVLLFLGILRFNNMRGICWQMTFIHQIQLPRLILWFFRSLFTSNSYPSADTINQLQHIFSNPFKDLHFEEMQRKEIPSATPGQQ